MNSRLLLLLLPIVVAKTSLSASCSKASVKGSSASYIVDGFLGNQWSWVHAAVRAGNGESRIHISHLHCRFHHEEQCGDRLADNCRYLDRYSDANERAKNSSYDADISEMLAGLQLIRAVVPDDEPGGCMGTVDVKDISCSWKTADHSRHSYRCEISCQ